MTVFRAARAHIFLWILVCGWGAYVLAIVVAPDAVLWATWKEGLVEHVGHVLLLAALLTWLAVAWRTARRPDTGALNKVLVVVWVAYLAFLLLEDIDWGDVYGLNLGAPWMRRLTGGFANLHNAQRAHGGLWSWSLLWMAAPLAGYFALTFVPGARPQAFWHKRAPLRALPAEALWFFVAAAAAVLFDSLPLLAWRKGQALPLLDGDPIGSALGYGQAFIYALLWLVGARVRADLAGPARAVAAPDSDGF